MASVLSKFTSTSMAPVLSFPATLKCSTERFCKTSSFYKFRVRNVRIVDSPPTVDLKITRNEPEFIFPAQPTPIERKPLSDYDNWSQTRVKAPFLGFYKRNPEMEGNDPAELIKRGLAKALVYFYPLAGRLVSTVDAMTGTKKLWVDCGGSSDGGVVFVKAEADIELMEVGDNILPPSHCVKQLLWTWEDNFDKEFESFTICGPLLMIQMTKFKCGGFALGVVVHHSIVDAYGMWLFFTAITELARGQNAPSIPPVWLRDQFLCARTHPQVTCVENEFLKEEHVRINLKTVIKDLRETTPISIFLNSKEIQALRDRHNLQSCTQYELITAYLWKCSTILRSPDPDQVIRLACVASVRETRGMKRLPKGYYGNSVLMPLLMCTAGDLIGKPLSHAVELVRKTKLKVRDPEYVRSLIDHIGIKPSNLDFRSRFAASDVSGFGLERFDFGWGKPVNVVSAIIRSTVTFYQTYNKIGAGKDEIMISMRAPQGFQEELQREMIDPPKENNSLQISFIV